MQHVLSYMESTGFRPLELVNNTYFLSGHQAVRLIGMQGSEGNPAEGISPHETKMMMYTIKVGTELYVADYVSFSNSYSTYLPTAQQMIDSFQLIGGR